MRLFTASACAAFKACDYQYDLLYVKGYRPLHTPKALVFGTLIHKALERYWNARKDGEVDPCGLALATVSDEIDRFDRARARVMIVAYAAVWGTVKCDVLAVEAKFIAPLIHPDTRQISDRYQRAGKIDVIIKLADKRIAVVEHKTSAMDVSQGSDYRAQLTIDEQVSFYYAGAISIGFRPDVVIYDVLKKFDEKPRVATPIEKRIYVTDRKTKEKRLKATQRDRDETAEEYERRLATAVAKDPSAHIERAEIVRLPAERKRFALHVWNDAQKMAHVIDKNLFTPNSKSCFRYGSPCGFVPHCLENAPLNDPLKFKKLKDVHPELEDGA